jgi:hypothetical protein
MPESRGRAVMRHTWRPGLPSSAGSLAMLGRCAGGHRRQEHPRPNLPAANWKAHEGPPLSLPSPLALPSNGGGGLVAPADVLHAPFSPPLHTPRSPLEPFTDA